MEEITEIVTSLRPGNYYASSLTDGYGALLALVADGKATFLGENIQPEGVKIVAVLVGKWRNPPERTIGISRHFFTTVLKDYEDWRVKWWREAIQNSVDAGATKIHCVVRYLEDKTVLVSVEDDGGGMDEDVLLNKFLMLGGTTKELGSGAAGGFGKAKELLILPWLAWVIHTRDRRIEGSGLGYTVHDAPFLHGTHLEVHMPADQHTHEAAVESFISRCYLPNVQFKLTVLEVNDDPQVSRPKADLVSDELISEVPGKVEIYVTPVDYTATRMYVRVNGLYMFDKWMNETPQKQVIAEIVGPSIEILTANRDGFRDWDTRHAVDKVVERVAKDTTSALRSKKGLIRRKYTGLGKFKAKEIESDALAEIGRVEETSKGVTSLSAFSLEQIENVLRRAAETEANIPDGDLARELLTSVTYAGAHHVEEAVKQLVWEPDFFIVNEIEGFKIPSKFVPATMKPQVVKLIRTWTEMCRYVLMQLGNFRPYGVGFMFSRNVLAAYLEEGDERWLMINPFVELYDEKATWKPTNMEHLKKLYALAIHECTHLADGIDYHDEAFATALTMNIAKTGDGFRKLRKIVNAIKMSDRPLVDVTSVRGRSVRQLKSRLSK